MESTRAAAAVLRRKLGGAARRLKDKASDRIHEMRHDAEEAVETGREAYRQTRDALNVGASKPGSPRP